MIQVEIVTYEDKPRAVILTADNGGYVMSPATYQKVRPFLEQQGLREVRRPATPEEVAAVIETAKRLAELSP